MSIIYRAIIEGDLQKALDIGRQRFKVIKDQPSEVHMLVRILQDLGEREEMLAMCAHLAASPMHRFFAGFQLAAAAADAGAPVETAVESAGNHMLAAERAAAVELLRDKTWINQHVPASRHIAICGTAFCGSTLLDVLLNGLPGVATIGESHWLTKSYGKSGTGPFDVSDLKGAHNPYCRRCGPACAVLTHGFRMRLLADPSGWYAKIAARLGAQILVSADKNLPKHVLNDPRLRFDALILYKSPQQAWASDLSKRPQSLEDTAKFAEMTKYVEMWRRSYAEMLDSFRPVGRKVYVNFDAFTQAPGAALERLSQALDLPYDSSVPHAGSPGHSIGGNRGTLVRLRDSNFNLAIDPLRSPDLPVGHAAWIDANAGVQEVYRAMNERAIVAP